MGRLYALAAALALGLVVTSSGCPAAHDDYPGTACKTDSDCYQGEHCMNSSFCVANDADLAVMLPDLGHLPPGYDMAGETPIDMTGGGDL